MQFIGRERPLYKRRGRRRKVKLNNRSYVTLDGARAAARSLANKYQFSIDIFQDETEFFLVKGDSRTPVAAIRNATREQIIFAVQNKTTVVVWEIPKGLLVFNPEDEHMVFLPEQKLNFVEEELDLLAVAPIFVIGVEGLAATDPHWDGSTTFHCQNPRCLAVHNTDELVAENLTRQNQSAAN
jgi:hypothetical protein